MSAYRIRRVRVVDLEGQLVGMISQADAETRVMEPEKIAGVVKEISRPEGDPLAVATRRALGP